MILTKQPTQTSLIVFFTAFFISLLFTSCETDPSKKIKEQNVELTKERLKNTGDFPVIEFDKNNHDFGEIQPIGTKQ